MHYAWILVVLCGGPMAQGQEANEPQDSTNHVAQQQTEPPGATQQAPATEAEVPPERHPTLLQMLLRNNQLRRSRGLWAHRMHPALARAAQDHANYMARTRDFSHYSNHGPSGRAYKYGFRGGVLENIAMGYGNVDTTFYGWQTSGGHWANMTSHTSDAGFGYAVSRDGTPFWVAVYGNAPSPPAVQQASAVRPVETAAAESESPADANSTADDSPAGDATVGGATAGDSASVATAPSRSSAAVVQTARPSTSRVFSAGSSGGRVRWLRRRR